MHLNFTNKKVIECFFITSSGGGSFTWNICAKIYKPNEKGYRNVEGYIERMQIQQFAEFKSCTEQGLPLTAGCGFPTKTWNVNGWLEIVIMCITPFSLVANQFFRKHSGNGKLSVNKFVKYLQIVPKHVKTRIAEALPDRFALLSDGWSAKGTHFGAKYDCYPTFTSCGFEKVVLAFAPKVSEEKIDSQNHYKLIKFVLDVFRRSFNNIVAVISDNCPTNLRLGQDVFPKHPYCMFIWCASHRFNRAVGDILGD